jgi:hypothetical protein
MGTRNNPAMSGEPSGLLFGDAFGPGQLETDATDRSELAIILELIAEHEGNEEEFKEIVASRFFEDARDPDERARLVALGLKEPGYQIVDTDFTFTSLGEQLYDLRHDEDQLYEEFARHILLNLHGRQVIEVIKDLRASGQKTTADTIKEALERRYGISIGETTNHWSQMRGWLHKAGIVNTGTHHYDIDTDRIREILDLSTDELETLESLTSEQRAFLRALAAIDPDDTIENTEVREVASNIHDTQIPQSKITSNILEPLADAGYIEITTRRGAPNLVKPTAEFDAAVLEPLLQQFAERIGVPREALQLRFRELDSVLESGSPSEQRTALTALGVRLGRHLGLEYVGYRTADHGGQETTNDVIMDDAEITLTRWLIHCSASRSKVTPTEVASVTTTARLTNANTILYVARSSFREDAERMATRIMKNEPYTILMLGEQPDPAYDEAPSALIEDVTEQLDSIRRSKAIPEDGPFRGRSFSDLDEDRETQRTVNEFENRFEEYMNDESDEKELSDFTD